MSKIDDILSQSSRLPGNSNATVRHSLDELFGLAASATMKNDGGSRQVMEAQGKRRIYEEGGLSGVQPHAIKLLASQGYDYIGATKKLNQMVMDTHYDNLELYQGGSVDGFVKHHHDLITATAIDRSKTAADERIRDTQNSWIA